MNMMGWYKFLGKPDESFPELVKGRHYCLVIKTHRSGFLGLFGRERPMIVFPIQCVYANWHSFYKNWKLTGGDPE